ncbi:hypothetical protein [Mucilaginibacter ginsenosidivorans]|uniref:Porin family protein n=1 Tax=Mucilaginibacter ginsenosidivorans TaxID=398053 RepID=A0A5B8UZZ8_9SPHI|nr:hypothetical protein [Mucilaginibacter ginsenosidivorans]QEC64582.1 hypothetical protein FRZ54_19075 [Mucilaginibacter ginsenosidivorans]
MKNRIKLIAIAATAVTIFFASNVKAQTTPPSVWRFGVGIEGGIPTGNAHDISNFELGGTARLQYGLSKNLALTLTSGYYNFFGKTYTTTFTDATSTTTVSVKGRSLGMIPVKAGVKGFFTDNLYIGGEVGAGFEVHPIVEGGEKDTKLILSPAIGWANKTWDVGVRYENFSGQSNNYGTVALRLAYGFPIK